MYTKHLHPSTATLHQAEWGVIAYALLERAYNAHSHTFVRHPMLTTASDDGDVAANDYF
jgi:hypothetical protein